MNRWMGAGVAGLLTATLLVAGGVWVARRAAAARVTPLTPQEQRVKNAVRDLWEALDVAAARGDAPALRPLFDLNTAGGREALAHAEARLAFVQAWAAARGVNWLAPRVTVRTPRIRISGNRATVTAIISEAWTYAYAPSGAVGTRGAAAQDTFGLGREHYMTLVETDGGWRIARDWFTDPLDQDTRIPQAALPAAPVAAPPLAAPRQPPMEAFQGFWAGLFGRGYDRAAAVRYADTYCGAAHGCGNGGRYNARFYDYNGEGGDCTNFVSQALSIGGHLRRSGTWGYDARTGEGTAAWVKAPALIHYLTASGLAKVVGRGRYAAVAGRVRELMPGDVIAYVENGKTVHLAMVTGSDPRGYTLVNSHTADRHMVPWDIGWDRATSFELLHIVGAAPAPVPLAGLVAPVAMGCGAA